MQGVRYFGSVLVQVSRGLETQPLLNFGLHDSVHFVPQFDTLLVEQPELVHSLVTSTPIPIPPNTTMLSSSDSNSPVGIATSCLFSSFFMFMKLGVFIRIG